MFPSKLSSICCLDGLGFSFNKLIKKTFLTLIVDHRQGIAPKTRNSRYDTYGFRARFLANGPLENTGYLKHSKSFTLLFDYLNRNFWYKSACLVVFTFNCLQSPTRAHTTNKQRCIFRMNISNRVCFIFRLNPG